MTRPSRLGLVQGAFVLFAIVLLGRAAQVQLWQGGAWRARAERQHVSVAALPAPRGTILDASGSILAESRELVKLAIAPREVRRQAALERALIQAGISRQWIRSHVKRDRAWVVVPGTFVPTDVAPLIAMRGVYAERASERTYTRSPGARAVIGHVGAEARGLDGLELALDSLLRGQPGKTTVLRDARGRRFESPTTPGTPPVPGHAVTLTLNNELQAIADRALADAISRVGASGGDIVVVRPSTGEVLALASHRRGGSNVATAFTEPFEPGSTAKPFAAAALLAHRRVRAGDYVDTHEGALTLYGRTIRDEHPRSRMTLTEVIAYSSNVGIARFAARLKPREQYEMLRDFGVGAPTGAPYPSEASGTLREPPAWSRQSSASLAIGYELSVTPMQLAMAYAAIANGGELLEPALIREVRSPSGDVVYRHRPRVVRRVVREEIAAQLRRMLGGVVESDGTGRAADLARFTVGGKTGTARRVRPGAGGYAPNEYTATFVGLFPADTPQYVILVKIDNPVGAYFGGQVAAPVSREILQAALAARDASLDRSALAPRHADESRSASADGGGQRLQEEPANVPYVIALTSAPRTRVAPKRSPRAVPDVRGVPLREAVHRLHRAGFRVQLAKAGGGGTNPAQGTIAAPGSVVLLQWDRR